MIQWEEMTYFYLLGVILVLLVLLLGVLYWRKRTQRRFANQDLLDRLSPERSSIKTWLKALVLGLAFVSLVLALVNPKIGTELKTIKREGVDLVFALDVSKSMLAEDIAPNRLEKAKKLISEVINTLGGDRVGIIGYAGSAFPQLPITTDFGSAKMFLYNMNTDMVSSQGTAINEAINLAQTYYNDEEQVNRVLFIVSDGEDHVGEVTEVAREAAKQGITIYTIGVGEDNGEGAWIPIKRDGVLIRYKRDENGERVRTKLNEQTLKDIAEASGGAYLNGNNTTDLVEGVNEILNNLDKSTFDAQQVADFKDQFQWFLAAAVFFLLLDILFLERKTAWLRGLNLFNEKDT
ncbi:VWA domain-containing protein [Gilvibacter sediminis]|uniref:VWA domain-containing protein n=1 Tax=Gilvibacter sediminis TaxID=379071 RepID=UPI002350763B|nr:VWA domain-containing protein [Gilvibacter sediminis]MDC7996989.1 VWA domain-containing protein [Gilvibacter sediminis]